MEFYDTKNWKREIKKTLPDKLLQMDDFEFLLYLVLLGLNSGPATQTLSIFGNT